MKIVEFIVIIGLFESIFMMTLIITKKTRTIADFILASFFLLFGISLLLSFIEISGRRNGFPNPKFLFTSSLPLMLHGPVLWLYVKSLTDQYFTIKLKYLWNLLPLLVLLLNHSLFLFFIPEQEKILLVETESFSHLITYPIFVIATAVLPLFYFYNGLQLLRRYRQRITGFFSDINHIDLKWLKILLILSLLFYGITGAVFIISLVYPIASFGLLHAICFAIGSVYIVALGFYGHKQESIFRSYTIGFKLDQRISMPNRTDIAESKDKTFINTLLNHMEINTPFLSSGLTLVNLANQLQVNTDYLSGILNGKLNTNFYDFINQYRVDFFKKQCALSENNNYSILGMAFDCGFNSKATFNRVFKNTTGLTPSAYLKIVSNEYTIQ